MSRIASGVVPLRAVGKSLFNQSFAAIYAKKHPGGYEERVGTPMWMVASLSDGGQEGEIGNED